MKSIKFKTLIIAAFVLGVSSHLSAQPLSGTSLEVDGTGDAVYFERDQGNWTNTKAKIGISSTSGPRGLRFQMDSRGRSRTSSFLYQNVMFLSQDGRVGINTCDPASGYQLTVKGKVICEEVKVQLRQNWPDYVFAPTYNLPSIHELETFIAQNGHLPNMPSAEEVHTADGFEVGDIAKKQQEKIEELFLYIIELNEKIDMLETRLKEQE